MRRAATWLVVAGLVALAAVALIETFLRDDEQAADRPSVPATTTSPSEQDLSEELEAAGARGLLYLANGDGERCELTAVRLPSLAIETGFSVPDCRIAVSPEGLVATGLDCDEASGALWDSNGGIVEQFSGCAPAWKPNGALTFLRDGEVLTAPSSCFGRIDECARVSLSKRDIRRGLPASETRAALREIAWLDATRMAAILRGGADFVAVFEGREPVVPPSFGTGRGRLTDLMVDGAARRVLAIGDETQGVFELDDLGRFQDTFPTPAVPEVRSLAIAPDGAWAAVSGRRFVVVFQTGDPPGRSFPLPYEAQPIAWLGALR
jgi:hypothetical protein